MPRNLCVCNVRHGNTTRTASATSAGGILQLPCQRHARFVRDQQLAGCTGNFCARNPPATRKFCLHGTTYGRRGKAPAVQSLFASRGRLADASTGEPDDQSGALSCPRTAASRVQRRLRTAVRNRSALSRRTERVTSDTLSLHGNEFGAYCLIYMIYLPFCCRKQTTGRFNQCKSLNKHHPVAPIRSILPALVAEKNGTP